MKILAIDTSTRVLCAGVSDGERNYEFNVEYGKKLSSFLVPVLERILKSLGWTAADVDCFGCGLGPGSFTGLRIGMSCIKGLAWSNGRKTAGIPSLDLLAMNGSGESGKIFCCLDARRGFFYTCVYQASDGRIKRLEPYRLMSGRECLGSLTGGMALLGDGAPVLKQMFPGQTGKIRVLDADHWRLRGGNLIRLVQEKISGHGLTDPLRLKPLYLYPKECQIRKPGC